LKNQKNTSAMQII